MNEGKKILIAAIIGLLIGAAIVFGFYQTSIRDSEQLIERVERENQDAQNRLRAVQTEIDNLSIGAGQASDEAGDIADGVGGASDGIGDVINGLTESIRLVGELIEFVGRLEEILSSDPIKIP